MLLLGLVISECGRALAVDALVDTVADGVVVDIDGVVGGADDGVVGGGVVTAAVGVVAAAVTYLALSMLFISLGVGNDRRGEAPLFGPPLD